MDSVAIRSLVGKNRSVAALTVAMLALTAVCLVGLVLDPRVLGGQPLWAKPLKFSISTALYAATLAWMIPMVTRPRARRWAGRMGVVVAVTLAIEMVAIVGQAARGRPSHFSLVTPVDAAVWATMATSITVLWVASAVLV